MAGSEGNKKRRDGDDRYRRAMLHHPLRRRILRLMLAGRNSRAGSIAEDLAEPLGEVLYHLRLLTRHGAVKAVPREVSDLELYRWSLEAGWIEEIPDEDEG